MHATLKRLRRAIASHKYRSQINRRAASTFGYRSKKHELLLQTIDAVTETHATGTGLRRLNGELLKSHEFAMLAIAMVYCGITDMAILLAILLHDMHEDYPEIWSLERIARIYGEEVAAIVAAVTKPDRELYPTIEAYDAAIFTRVRAGGIKAMIVKCIDRLHNMLTLYGEPVKKKRKILQTLLYVIPTAIDCKKSTTNCKGLVDELVLATTEQMYKLKLQKGLYPF